MSPSIDAPARVLRQGCLHRHDPCNGSRQTDSKGKEKRGGGPEGPDTIPRCLPATRNTCRSLPGTKKLPDWHPPFNIRPSGCHEHTKCTRPDRREISLKRKLTLRYHFSLMQLCIFAIVYPLTLVSVHIVKTLMLWNLG